MNAALVAFWAFYNSYVSRKIGLLMYKKTVIHKNEPTSKKYVAVRF